MKKIKNVIIVCDYAYVEGGAAKVAIQTAISLKRYSEYKIIYLAGCGEICDELKNNGIEALSLGLFDLLGNPSRINAMKNGIYNKTAEIQIRNFLNGFNADETIIHVHTWTKVLSSAIYKVANDKNIPVFLTIHDYFLTCPNGGCFNYVTNEICHIQPLSFACLKCNCDSRNYPQKVWRCLRQYKQNNVIRHCDNIHYIFISDFEEKQIRKRLDMPMNTFKLQNVIQCEKGERIKCENNNDYVFIGRISKEKGICLFCEAIQKTGVKGIVIGDGALKDQLASQYPKIQFTGWLKKEEINEKLKDARALIFPSLWYEGSPLTIPEVQSFGIPCIVTNTNAGTDTIIHRQNGYIVNPNVNDIVSTIEILKDDNAVKRLSLNTYNIFDFERGSQKKYTEKLITIYRAVEGK